MAQSVQEIQPQMDKDRLSPPEHISDVVQRVIGSIILERLEHTLASGHDVEIPSLGIVIKGKRPDQIPTR